MTADAPESQTVREAEALAAYRSGTLTRYQLQRLLGFESRWETEAWLGDMGEHETYTLADLEADRRTLQNLFPR